jgi:hypothetical protein
MIAGTAAVMLYLPWIPHLRGKELAVIAALEPLTARNVITDLMRPIAGYPYAPLSAIPAYGGLALIIVSALTGVLFLITGRVVALRSSHFGSSRAASLPKRFWLLVLLAMITPIGMLIYSEVATDLWLARGLYASVPAAALVLAALLMAIPRPINVAATAIVVGTLTFGTIRATSPNWKRPPTRAIAAYIDRTALPGEPVAFISFIAEPAVLAQMHKTHHVVAYTALKSDTAPGADAYLVVEDHFARLLHLPNVPFPPTGFQLVAQRHYASSVLPLDVSVYRRAGH